MTWGYVTDRGHAQEQTNTDEKANRRSTLAPEECVTLKNLNINCCIYVTDRGHVHKNKQFNNLTNTD